MSRDIYIHVEVQHLEHGWLHYNHPRCDRCEDLCVKMLKIERRGLPKDVTQTTLLDYSRFEQGHSSSWLSWEEIKSLETWYDENIVPNLNDRHPAKWHKLNTWFGYLFGHTYKASRCNLPSWLIDVRVCFWLDG